MGAWGPGLYQDDVAEDIRDDYKEGLKKVKEEISLTDQIIADNQYALIDPDDTPIFWFALADTQWKMGRLEDRVKEKALFYLEDGGNLRRWEKENPKQAKKRAEVLESLKAELLSPQPEKKKISIPRLYKCEWQIGDVYVYPLDSEQAIEQGFSGKYLLFHKIRETTWHPGHVIPVIRMKMCELSNLPKNTTDFDALPYLQIAKRVYIKPLFRTQEPTGQEKMLKEHGVLPVFQAMLFNTSKRIIPKKIFYLNNFINAKPPELEWIPPQDLSLSGVLWKWFDKSMLSNILTYQPDILKTFNQGNFNQGQSVSQSGDGS